MVIKMVSEEGECWGQACSLAGRGHRNTGRQSPEFPMEERLCSDNKDNKGVGERWFQERVPFFSLVKLG